MKYVYTLVNGLDTSYYKCPRAVDNTSHVSKHIVHLTAVEL